MDNTTKKLRQLTVFDAILTACNKEDKGITPKEKAMEEFDHEYAGTVSFKHSWSSVDDTLHVDVYSHYHTLFSYESEGVYTPSDLDVELSNFGAALISVWIDQEQFEVKVSKKSLEIIKNHL